MSGQTFQRTGCRKPHDLGVMGSYSSNDVFMRLAEASMRDSKIEQELQLMELI
ncbi:MAG: hypothetical protein LUE64_05450 [Candidatus Gastranaerophilales bacterium]|nr:hypothetical protein [Candidatus Gastranaerophilales bacterium]